MARDGIVLFGLFLISFQLLRIVWRISHSKPLDTDLILKQQQKMHLMQKIVAKKCENTCAVQIDRKKWTMSFYIWLGPIQSYFTHHPVSQSLLITKVVMCSSYAQKRTRVGRIFVGLPSFSVHNLHKMYAIAAASHSAVRAESFSVMRYEFVSFLSLSQLFKGWNHIIKNF